MGPKVGKSVGSSLDTSSDSAGLLTTGADAFVDTGPGPPGVGTSSDKAGSSPTGMVIFILTGPGLTGNGWLEATGKALGVFVLGYTSSTHGTVSPLSTSVPIAGSVGFKVGDDSFVCI